VVSGDLKVDFVMIDETGTTVACTVTREAIEYLSGPGSAQQFDRLDAYTEWQDCIERIATDKYDAYRFVGGRIVIDVGDVARISTSSLHHSDAAP
jgi:hypothetical protein